MVLILTKTISTHSGLSHEAGLEPLSDTLQVQVDAHQPELPAPLD